MGRILNLLIICAISQAKEKRYNQWQESYNGYEPYFDDNNVNNHLFGNENDWNYDDVTMPNQNWDFDHQNQDNNFQDNIFQTSDFQQNGFVPNFVDFDQQNQFNPGQFDQGNHDHLNVIVEDAIDNNEPNSFDTEWQEHHHPFPPIIPDDNQIDLMDAIENQGNSGPPPGFIELGPPPPGFINKIIEYDYDSEYALSQYEMYDEEGMRFDEMPVELANDMKNMINIINEMDESGQNYIYDDETGVGFETIEIEFDADGSELKRLEQMFGGIEVDGAQLIEHEYKGDLVWLVDKHTGKKTRQIQRPNTKKRVGSVMTASRVTKTFNIENYDASGAMRKFKELRGGPFILNEVEEIIISFDYSEIPEVVYRVSFLKMGHIPSIPMAIYNSTTNELIAEWDDMGDIAVPMGAGPGGNENTGKLEYGKNKKTKLIVNDMGNGSCSYSTPNVTVLDLKQDYNMDKNETFTYSCYNQESDEFNGGYSALNDALYHAQLVYDMFQAWYNRPAWKNGTLIKVHYGENDANARFNPSKKGKYIFIGDGNSKTFPPTTLQIIAHEIGHGVTYETSNLERQGSQSAALNEMFSDATAMAIERYVYGSNKKVDWKIGKGFFKDKTKQLRCMDDPKCPGDDTRGNESPSGIDHVKDLKKHGQDKYMQAGIWRKIFYQLSEKYDVWDVYDIFFITNTKFWQQKTKFKQAAQLMLRAVSEMKQGLHLLWDYHYLKIDDVIEAFKQVGINCEEVDKSYKCEGENLE